MTHLQGDLPTLPKEHETYMALAIDEAQKALSHGDVPVGAVVVDTLGNVVSRAHNERELQSDPTAHAEILALKAAAIEVGTWRLDAMSVYVTLEPCPMCAGALVGARVASVTFGAVDPKAGSCQTLYNICDDPRLNHQLRVNAGVLAKECGVLLSDFFTSLRQATQ